MVSKRDAKLVLWPIYFDAQEPRPWRRVPRDIAIHAPTADAIAKAAAKLRLSPVLERGAAHPRTGYAHDGRVLVDVRGSKGVLVRQIAEILSEGRRQA